MKEETIKQAGFIERLASHVRNYAGSNTAFIIAMAMVVSWLLAGSAFHYSNNWLWLINTTTTTITFLMVFLLQKTQNKDSLAIQLKLNELLAAHKEASNNMVNVENMSEEELKIIQQYYLQLNESRDKKRSVDSNKNDDNSTKDPNKK